MIYNLVKFDDPILYKKTEFFNFDKPPIDPKELYDNMKETMIAKNGYGLTCNQVGLPYSMFVFGDPLSPETITGAFNPKIVDLYGSEELLEEGCLSFPGLFLKIKRRTGIRARFTTYNGVTGTKTIDGITAIIYQHEMEHIYGNPFYHSVGRLKLEMAIKKAEKRGFKYPIKKMIEFGLDEVS